jgi:hypothetical protein
MKMINIYNVLSSAKRLITRYKLFNLLILAALLPAWQPIANPGWQAKIDPWLLERAGPEPIEFLVYLSEQANLQGATHLEEKASKGTYIYQRLFETARLSQAPLLAALNQRRIEVRSYWIANLLWVRGSAADLQFIASRPEVAHIYPNPQIHLDLPNLQIEPAFMEIFKSYAIENLRESNLSTVEWNIQKVNAPLIWAAGITGQGAVIAGQDTGYKWDHPALINQYRGWDGASADHNYNWHDAIHPPTPGAPTNNPCGYDSLVPCDDNSHGTHTMGTMVGDDGAGNQIGMAPGARWIGCRNMDQNVGTPATYIECFQWFVAPTDLEGNNPRPDLAPDVINNSWACPPSEGCNWASLQPAIEAVRAAGILVVASAGNSGSSCSTVNNPPAIYQAAFSVGATNDLDLIANFSSRGPVTIDGSYRLKPDVSAPGVSVRSSTLYGYAASSGTSMAAPHVSGLAALLISAEPSLHGQVDQLETIIEQTALPRIGDKTCGDIPPTQIPNNTYGYGRIDAWAAYQTLQPEPFYRLYLPVIHFDF